MSDKGGYDQVITSDKTEEEVECWERGRKRGHDGCQGPSGLY